MRTLQRKLNDADMKKKNNENVTGSRGCYLYFTTQPQTPSCNLSLLHMLTEAKASSSTDEQKLAELETLAVKDPSLLGWVLGRG